jgi:carbonic anhydrase
MDSAWQSDITHTLCKDSGMRKPIEKTLKQRRKFLKTAGLATLGLATTGMALNPLAVAASPPKPQNQISPNDALQRLMAGNERYVKGNSKAHDFSAEREALIGGQNPFASILSCADSRIAPEYAFDSARGDLFVVRVAGNFVSKNGLASLEYSANFLGTRLFMVLGHQGCGAVGGAIATINDGSVLPGHMPHLVEAISPAVGLAKGQPGELLENSIRENVRLNVATLKAASPILSKLVASDELKIVGGIYRLDTGRVELLA